MKQPADILDTKEGLPSHEYSMILYSREDCLQAMIEYAEQFKEKKVNPIEDRKYIFRRQCEAVIGNPVCFDQTTIDFFDYWTEIGTGQKKMRFEKEKVFDISKRLARWKNNNFKSNGKPTKQTRHDKFNDAFNRADANIGAVETFD